MTTIIRLILCDQVRLERIGTPASVMVHPMLGVARKTCHLSAIHVVLNKLYTFSQCQQTKHLCWWYTSSEKTGLKEGVSFHWKDFEKISSSKHKFKVSVYLWNKWNPSMEVLSVGLYPLFDCQKCQPCTHQGTIPCSSLNTMEETIN